MVSQDDKTQAMLMWILAIFFHFVGPLIFLLISKDKPFVYRHSAMGLTLSIVTAILWCLGIPLAFIGIGFIVLPVAGILQLVGCIMGAVAANKGEEFDPPVIANIAKSMFKV
ncbi:MAG: uncharacterized protein QOJ65_2802 [Fimbriimonadaceae bacterium]|nr:uncharacterized protein [Fimbriimonadaceae bacterium]